MEIVSKKYECVHSYLEKEIENHKHGYSVQNVITLLSPWKKKYNKVVSRAKSPSLDEEINTLCVSEERAKYNINTPNTKTISFKINYDSTTVRALFTSHKSKQFNNICDWLLDIDLTDTNYIVYCPILVEGVFFICILPLKEVYLAVNKIFSLMKDQECVIPEESEEALFLGIYQIISQSFDEIKTEILTENRRKNEVYSSEEDLNELGIPFHPKEKEVQAMLERSEQGLPPEQPYIPKRKGGRWESPIAFLEEVYGKYLSLYNKENDDFLFQDQLRKIDLRFLSTLQQYILRRNETIADYIAPKTARITKEIEQLEGIEGNTKNIKNYKKINKIKGHIYSRKRKCK